MEAIRRVVETLFKERVHFQEEHFYIEGRAEKVLDTLLITRKLEWVGIVEKNDERKLLLPPVFEQIEIADNDKHAIVRIGDFWGVWNILEKNWGVYPSCISLIKHYDYDTIELITTEGHGLFSLRESRMVINPVYDDVTCWCEGDFLWVRNGAWCHFVRKQDGMFISMIEAIKAYDTTHGMFIMRKDNMVFCVNEDGLDDPRKLRQFVMRNHGRASLYNYKLHCIDIIDVYGYVLNATDCTVARSFFMPRGR